MVRKYKHSELMWQKLAKIHFDGFIYHQETEQLHYDKNYINGIRSVFKQFKKIHLYTFIYLHVCFIETALKPMKMV